MALQKASQRIDPLLQLTQLHIHCPVLILRVPEGLDESDMDHSLDDVDAMAIDVIAGRCTVFGVSGVVFIFVQKRSKGRHHSEVCPLVPGGVAAVALGSDGPIR